MSVMPAGTVAKSIAFPEAVAQQLPQLLGTEGDPARVVFVPVRHHSPACAWALRALLRELRPAAILIEGPDDVNSLLPLMSDPQTRPPVAWLCQAVRERPAAISDDSTDDAAPEAGADADPDPGAPRTDTRSSFYPFCDYSPEWIALREGAALGAQVALIDLPWQDKAWEREDGDGDGDGDAETLGTAARSQMEERHFAHSRYLTAMARQLGCGDHHDLWDRLFELRSADQRADWRSLFADVFSWCAMARLDYEPEVLEAELSLPRERHMAAHIQRWRAQVQGTIVVVTGGFHTPELMRLCAANADASTDAKSTSKPRKAKATPAAKAAKASAAAAAPNAWLIRYSFEQLDALNGYSAGMPSPGYYQRLWEAWNRSEAEASATSASRPLGSPPSVQAEPVEAHPPVMGKQTPRPMAEAVAAPAQVLRQAQGERGDIAKGAGAATGAHTPPTVQAEPVEARHGLGTPSPFIAVALDVLTGYAQQTRQQDQADAISTALVQAAALQAQRLADLRGNAGPGRQDLLDAIRSCFVKGAIDEGTRGFTADLRAYLSGTRMGEVPPSAGSPPLIEDARRLARAAGVRLDDTTARTTRLDLYRKPTHRVRSRFFQAMAYLDTGLAQWVNGPDFLAGTRLNLLFEEWHGAWSPLVEARLLALAADGASVEAACLAKLQREEAALADEGRGRSASAAVMLLLRACLVGLQHRLPQLLGMLSTHLNEDASIGSVIDCGHRLVTLWRAREPLGVQQHPELRRLLARVWPAALFLLPNLQHSPAEAEAQAVQYLLALRELGRMLQTLDAPADGGTTAGAAPTPAPASALAIDPALLIPHLQRFATEPDTSPGVCGAATALLYLEGLWDDAQLDTVLRQRFGPGAVPADAVRFLNGVMQAAPELLLRLPALLQGLDALVRGWDEAAFIAHLPDLRQAFTALRPQDTATLAERVVGLHGGDAGAASALVAMHYETSEADLQAGLALQQALQAALLRDGLGAWVGQ
ncbi:DUF5682 family protein [Acidovorax sp. 106]|uniref:DUF5682 family protein n=1 Tax=Acidovorax sp. 106 TaxID=2135637 RepID=UPI000F269303|nr:DUF5682 family protein [Acidovorax sp. 106]RLJ37668.1 hypothetical protein C8C98_1385 [Acidovorax sp. 106]